MGDPVTGRARATLTVTAPIVIRTYLSIFQTDYGVFLAGTLLAIIPPAILFFALQKEFVSGLSAAGRARA